MSYNASDTSDIDITGGVDSERWRELECLTDTTACTTTGHWREHWRGIDEMNKSLGLCYCWRKSNRHQ